MYPHERSLVKRLEGRPFVLLGVNSDDDREELKDRMKKEGITWRSWWDEGRKGPIANRWGVYGWPKVYVLDAQGVIRYEHVRGDALDQAVDTLLKALEQGAAAPAKPVQTPDRERTGPEDREKGDPESPPPAPVAPAFVVQNAQEGETLRVLAHEGDGIVETQPVGKYFGLGRWSRDEHLWWRSGKPGDHLKIQFSSVQAGAHAIVLAMTRAPDYGIFKVSVNGKVVAESLDLYQPDGVGVEAMTFENVELKAGENELLFEIVGTNPKAHAWKDLGLYMMGMDYVLVK